jgi:hypothetical protein
MRITHATPAAPAAAHASPWYTHRWPWFLMLGPATVLVGGAVATWLALDHPDAMVVDDYYKQGKAINQDLRRDRVASAMSLVLRLRYEDARLQGRIESAGRPLAAQFTIHLAHPTLPQRDMTLLILPGADGSFSVPLPALERTHWQVVVEGRQRDWRLAASWSWPRKRDLTIAADPV